MVVGIRGRSEESLANSRATANLQPQTYRTGLYTSWIAHSRPGLKPRESSGIFF